MNSKLCSIGAATLMFGLVWFLVHLLAWGVAAFAATIVSGLYEISRSTEERQDFKDVAAWMDENALGYFIIVYSIGSGIAGALASHVYVTMKRK
jgi:hypothetical protein